ncbi:MAG: hypothetical protein GY863_01085 [bacterium]|nr:hypothetical protein [bacterium]
MKKAFDPMFTTKEKGGERNNNMRNLKVKSDTILYTVDDNCIILDVIGNWDDFADSNGGKNISKPDIIGRNMLDFIAGEHVKHIYKQMHDIIIRSESKEIAFKYRCDSHLVRRYMSMRIKNSNSNSQYISKVEEEVPFDNKINIEYDNRTGEIVVMCSFCKGYRFPKDTQEWKPIEHIFENTPDVFQISHGICKKCLKIAEASMNLS